MADRDRTAVEAAVETGRGTPQSPSGEAPSTLVHEPFSAAALFVATLLVQKLLSEVSAVLVC